ncbi:MAG: hypothetical protein ACREVV_04915 [Steroidobacteraceae bacterium]
MSDPEAPQIPADAPRNLYGADGQPQFFQDPAMDRFVAVILKLTQELWVMNERLATLEQRTSGGQLPDGGPLHASTQSANASERDVELSAFIHRVLGPLREP